MSPSVLIGASYLTSGLGLIARPGLRWFVLLPLSVNIIVFAGMLYGLIQQFDQAMTLLVPSVPDWLQWMEYVLWPVFVVLLLVMVFFTFTLIAGLLAAPFNGLLSEKVEQQLRGQSIESPFSWRELIAIAPRTFQREWQTLGYFLPRTLGLVILSFIPMGNLLAAPLWLLWGVWMVSVQYVDYPADNHQFSWSETLSWLRERRWATLGFGSVTYLALLIPGLNLLIMPAAVAGATQFWVQEQRHSKDL